MCGRVGLRQMGRFGGAGQFAEGGERYQEGQGNSNHAAEAVEESLGAGFAAQGFGGLGIESGLEGSDLRLLVGELFLLIGDFFSVTRSQRVLHFLLLTLRYRLTVLLQLLVAGVSGEPDQTVRLRYRDWGQGLHASQSRRGLDRGVGYGGSVW